MTAEAYVPLYYAPGEAYQFDWSHETQTAALRTADVQKAKKPFDRKGLVQVQGPLVAGAGFEPAAFRL